MTSDASIHNASVVTAGSQKQPACKISHGSYFDGKVVSSTHKKLFAIIMMAYFFEQMDNVNFGYVAQSMFDSWGLAAAQANRAMGLILSFYFIGMTLGGFFGGIISDIIGRRKTFLGAIMIFSTCSIITGLPIDNLYVFIVARSLTGFGIFCMMVCSQVYIAEMSPANARGRWQGLVGTMGFCAMPVVGIICTIVVPLSPSAWRFIFFFGGTGFFAFLLGTKYLKESPRWLVSQGRVKEAESVVTYFTGEPCDLRQEAENHCVAKPNIIHNLLGMLSGKYLGRTALLVLVFVAFTPAGFVTSSWLPKLMLGLTTVNPDGEVVRAFTQREALAMMTLITCGTPLGCFICSRVSEYGGRKIPLIVCMALAGVASMLFAFAPVSGPLMVFLGIANSAMGMTASMTLMTYTAEHYPTHMRNTATGTLNAIGRLSVSAMQMCIPPLLVLFSTNPYMVNHNLTVVLALCSVLSFISVPFILRFGARTGGKTLEEIS